MSGTTVHYNSDRGGPGPIVRSDVNNAHHIVHGAYGLAPLLDTDGGTLDVKGHVFLTLSWFEKRPFEITLAFTGITGSAGPTWTIGRALLAQGGGEGDVQVAQVDDDTVRVRLCSPSGLAVFELDRSWVDRFIDVTEDIVLVEDELDTEGEISYLERLFHSS